MDKLYIAARLDDKGIHNVYEEFSQALNEAQKWSIKTADVYGVYELILTAEPNYTACTTVEKV